jgi:hypothetical protein
LGLYYIFKWRTETGTETVQVKSKARVTDGWQEEEIIPTGWKDPNHFSNVHHIHQGRIADKVDAGVRDD